MIGDNFKACLVNFQPFDPNFSLLKKRVAVVDIELATTFFSKAKKPSRFYCF